MRVTVDSQLNSFNCHDIIRALIGYIVLHGIWLGSFLSEYIVDRYAQTRKFERIRKFLCWIYRKSETLELAQISYLAQTLYRVTSHEKVATQSKLSPVVENQSPSCVKPGIFPHLVGGKQRVIFQHWLEGMGETLASLSVPTTFSGLQPWCYLTGDVFQRRKKTVLTRFLV